MREQRPTALEGCQRFRVGVSLYTRWCFCAADVFKVALDELMGTMGNGWLREAFDKIEIGLIWCGFDLETVSSVRLGVASSISGESGLLGRLWSMVVRWF